MLSKPLIFLISFRIIGYDENIQIIFLGISTMTNFHNAKNSFCEKQVSTNPFLGWPLDELNETQDELVEIVGSLSQRVRFYAKNPDKLEKLRNLKEARNVLSTFRFCKSIQHDLEVAIAKFHKESSMEETEKSKTVSSQIKDEINFQISSISGMLVDQKDSRPAPLHPISRMVATTGLISALVTAEAFFLSEDIPPNLSKASKLAKVVYAATCFGGIYIGYREQINAFCDAAREAVVPSKGQVLPHVDALYRLDRLTIHSTKLDASNRNGNGIIEPTRLTRRDVLQFRFAHNRG
jgi:hypothetical protein